MTILIDYAQSIIDRVKLSVDTNSALSKLSEWVCTYTKLDVDTFFSFKDHEFQIDIINDTNARQVTQKCSQVGLTEIQLRKKVGIVAISSRINAIYAMPTSKLASKTSTSRIKPIISCSPLLSQMQNKDAKGVELLGLGSSFLHLAGTSGAATGAISVPANYVDIDELDFCNIDVVEMFESRLKHAPEDEFGRKGSLCYYSTPTVDDYGINAKFKLSDQKHYQVNCSHCENNKAENSWFAPDYFRDLVIPTWNRPLIELTPEDIRCGDYPINEAYMRCPTCLNDVWDDLCNPKRRKWIAKFPNSIISGRQVHPWDLPKFNSIPSIFMAMLTYEENIANYYNFIIGIPFSDKNNSFLLSPFSSGNYSKWNEKKLENDTKNYCIGVDVGRTSHIIVGYKDKKTEKLNITYLERFKASKSCLLGERVVALARQFKTKSIVIDGMPDFTTTQYVAKKFPTRIVLSCEYTGSKPKGKLSNYKVNLNNNLVSAYRTGVLTEILNLHNSGNILYPDSHVLRKIKLEIDEVKLNLKHLKRVKRINSSGEDFDSFVKIGPDHYGHALSYLNIACRVLNDDYISVTSTASPTSILSFKTQGDQKSKPAKMINAIGRQGYGQILSNW